MTTIRHKIFKVVRGMEPLKGKYALTNCPVINSRPTLEGYVYRRRRTVDGETYGTLEMSIDMIDVLILKGVDSESKIRELEGKLKRIGKIIV